VCSASSNFLFNSILTDFWENHDMDLDNYCWFPIESCQNVWTCKISVQSFYINCQTYLAKESLFVCIFTWHVTSRGKIVGILAVLCKSCCRTL
jgi:hypothetical protein